jgi:osmotically-inducible protein OsmY
MAKLASDHMIKDDVLRELDWEPQVSETKIGVIVKNGAVTLTGTVPSYLSKTAAKQAAKRVGGVRAITDELAVKLPSELRYTDEGIAERAANVLNWSVPITNHNIKAEVQDGRAILTGEVDWDYQRRQIERQIEAIRGIVSVMNRITIKPHADQHDIEDGIKKALHRHAEIEASHIQIAVEGGKVTLSGDVDAYFEKELVKDAAWSAPGVTHVVDNLHVS